MHKVLIYFHHLDGNHLNIFTYRVINNPNFDALLMLSEFTSCSSRLVCDGSDNLYEATLDEKFPGVYYNAGLIPVFF